MDDKSKKQLIAIGCMLPLLLVAWLFAFGSCKRGAAPGSAAPPDGAAAALLPAVVPTVSVSQPEAAKIEALPWDRNPFRSHAYAAPLTSAGPAGRAFMPTMRLEGIVWDAKNPYAIIDGEIRTAGDSVQGFTVKEIRKDKVTLEKDGQRYDLGLFPELDGR